MQITAISDTHNKCNSIQIPNSDLLLHAGDCTMMGGLDEFACFANWFGSLPGKTKILIPGNHDFCLQTDIGLCKRIGLDSGFHILVDETIILGKHHIHGIPWIPKLATWAFYATEEFFAQKLELIPVDTTILVSHAPAYKILDKTANNFHTGWKGLRDVIKHIKPQLHICGHIHEAHGTLQKPDTLHINASLCDAKYQPTLTPITITLED